ncbi:hypothetical protein K3495_g5785 [Podosphaera aphanis]|nr:hypothetical protein K3495_g5785 [Podosphaera aphanis]
MSLEFAKKTDPAGLWKALLDLDPNKDPTNIDTLRESFYSVKIDQSKDTIQSVLLRLNNIRAKFSLTSRPVSHLDVKERLIASLPKDKFWATARLHAREAKKTLTEALTYLQACEANYNNDVTKQNVSIQVARGMSKEKGPKRKTRIQESSWQEPRIW